LNFLSVANWIIFQITEYIDQHIYAQRETTMNDIPKLMKGIQLKEHGGLEKALKIC